MSILTRLPWVTARPLDSTESATASRSRNGKVRLSRKASWAAWRRNPASASRGRSSPCARLQRATPPTVFAVAPVLVFTAHATQRPPPPHTPTPHHAPPLHPPLP